MATWRDDNTLTAGTAANGTLTKPSGTVAGDLLGIFYSLENDVPITAPNGFIITTNQDHSGAAHDQFFVWKRAGGSEAASYVMTHASTWRSGYIVGVQNASATRNPHGGAANQGTGSTGTALGLNTEAADAYVLATYTTFGDMGLITPTGGWTERYDSTNNIYAQDKAMGAAGATGDAAISFGGSQQWMARQIAIEDDGYDTTNPTVIQVKHNVITASRSPSVTFDFAPLEDDIVAFWPSSTTTGATLTIPADWTNVLSGTTDVESDSHQICAVYHRVTSAEAGSSTVTFTATDLYGAGVTGNVMGVVIRNVDTTTAVDVSSSTSSNTNTVTPHVLAGLTPTVDDGLFMSGVAADGTGIYCIPPTGYDLAALNTNQGKAVAWRETLTANGVAISAVNITPSAGDEYASISVVWRKASAGGATDLVVADLTVASVIDAPALTQDHTLVVADLTVASVADAPTLTQEHSLVVADLEVVVAVDAVTLSVTSDLVVADLTVAAVIDAPTLTQAHQLVVADLTVTAAVDAPSLTQVHQLAVSDATVTTTIDSVTLAVTGDLVVADLAVAAVIDTPTLTQVHELAVADLTITTTIDSVTLTAEGTLVVADVTVASVIDAPTLTQVHVLAVADLTVTVFADAPTLTQLHQLAVSDLVVVTTIDTVALGAAIIQAITTCDVNGPALDPYSLSGPALVSFDLSGPALARAITGPAVEVVSATGPALETVTATGPALSRTVTGPAIEDEPDVSSGPETSRVLTGPAVCSGE